MANKKLQDGMTKEELISLDAIDGFKRVEREVQQLKAKMELLGIATEDLVLKSSFNVVRGSRTRDKVLKTVESHYMRLAMHLFRSISIWPVAEVSEL